MLTASRVLGTEVGSTAPVFLAFLAIHVLGGITAVACGAVTLGKHDQTTQRPSMATLSDGRRPGQFGHQQLA